MDFETALKIGWVAFREYQAISASDSPVWFGHVHHLNKRIQIWWIVPHVTKIFPQLLAYALFINLSVSLFISPFCLSSPCLTVCLSSFCLSLSLSVSKFHHHQGVPIAQILLTLYRSPSISPNVLNSSRWHPVSAQSW